MSSSTKKALFAVIFFASVGAFGWFQVADGYGSLPLLAYYAVLLINTFFSIRTLSAITPTNTVQTLFDVVLAALYCALALSFGSVLLFSGISASLFFIAIAKYVHLDRLIAKPKLLHRKIQINALGALLSLLAFGMATFGPIDISAWTLCVVFSLANIYLLAINPMYRLD